MTYLSNNGLSTQISEIKAYVSNSITSAINTFDTSIKSYIANQLTSCLSLTGGNLTGNLTIKNVLVLPPGIIQAYSGSTLPTGWLLCDGSAISRTTYSDLFDIIGITYGSGDGSSTFNLPNLIDKFIEGGNTAGTVKAAGLPNITGEAYLQPTQGGVDTVPSAIGAFTTTTEAIRSSNPGAGDSTFSTSSTSPYYTDNINLDASRSSSIYGNSTTVQPPALVLKYIIKY